MAFPGRLPFSQTAAEAAIRRAYEAGGLPEPSHIVWAAGPNETAQVLAFLERPPQLLRWIAVALFFVGAAMWAGLALAVDGAGASPSPARAAGLSVFLAGFGLALAGRVDLPRFPGFPPPGRRSRRLVIGAAIFVALAGSAFALQRLVALPNNPVDRSLVLGLAASVGGLPGLFLGLRIRWVYSHLPPWISKITLSISVARRLERARGAAWAPFRQAQLGSRLDPSLLEAYRSAFWEAAAVQWTASAGGVLGRPVRPLSWDAVGGAAAWPSPGRGALSFAGDNVIISSLPPHLDGVETAARAEVVARSSVSGAAAAFTDLALRTDRLYAFAAVAVAVRPPTIVALDAGGRPHADSGPALAWADGTCVFAWRGRIVAPNLVDPSQPVTLLRIAVERDPGRRSVLIERYGLGRYMQEAGAVELCRDDCGRLYRLEQPWGEPVTAVRVVNHSPEPDGSHCEFWLRVPPNMATARDAVAWTFGLSAQAYDPVAQS